MVSGDLKKKIEDFIKKVDEPYVKVEKVPFGEIDTLYNKYVLKILALNEESRIKVLDILEQSIRANCESGKLRQWERLCIGIAIILDKEESDNVNKEEAADIIVRISRWYHTDVGFYQSFVPWAKRIVNLIWGGIDNLYYKK